MLNATQFDDGGEQLPMFMSARAIADKYHAVMSREYRYT